MAKLTELMQGTQKALPVTLTRLDLGKIKVESIREQDFIGTKTKVFNSTIRSSEGGKSYNTQVAFFGIDPKEDTPQTNKTRVGVRCSCAAYKFWFAHVNRKSKAAFGAKFPAIVENNFPDVRNPSGKIGACKHVWLLVRTLRFRDDVN